MKKIKLSKSKVIELFNLALKYIAKTEAKIDKLSNACKRMIEYEPNDILLEAHNKLIEKHTKKLERDCRDASVYFAMLDEDKTIKKDTEGNMKFTTDNQLLYNKKVDELNDAYQELINDIMKLKVDLYLPSVKESELPTRLTVEDKNGLSLLIQ